MASKVWNTPIYNYVLRQDELRGNIVEIRAAIAPVLNIGYVAKLKDDEAETTKEALPAAVQAFFTQRPEFTTFIDDEAQSPVADNKSIRIEIFNPFELQMWSSPAASLAEVRKQILARLQEDEEITPEYNDIIAQCITHLLGSPGKEWCGCGRKLHDAIAPDASARCASCGAVKCVDCIDTANCDGCFQALQEASTSIEDDIPDR